MSRGGAMCPKDCPKRCVVPNCHNEETCPVWAEYMRQKREAQAARERVRGPEKDLDAMSRNFGERYRKEAKRHR